MLLEGNLEQEIRDSMNSWSSWREQHGGPRHVHPGGEEVETECGACESVKQVASEYHSI